MDSREVELQGYIERYLAGRLFGDEREAFEIYWFASSDAFENLRDGLRIRAGFSGKAPPCAPADPQETA